MLSALGMSSLARELANMLREVGLKIAAVRRAEENDGDEQQGQDAAQKLALLTLGNPQIYSPLP